MVPMDSIFRAVFSHVVLRRQVSEGCDLIYLAQITWHFIEHCYVCGRLLNSSLMSMHLKDEGCLLEGFLEI